VRLRRRTPEMYEICTSGGRPYCDDVLTEGGTSPSNRDGDFMSKALPIGKLSPAYQPRKDE
jgi:hypothetical protein